MIQEPPNADRKAAPSSPASSAPFSESEREAQRDRDHTLHDDLEDQLASLRDSFDERADELRRRTTRFRAAIDLRSRIRDRPLAAMAIGATAGAAVALVRPMGRASSGLAAFLVARAARYLALEVAERVYQELMNPPDLRADAR
jgi:ElaB/YqjD/DUF883 family membrane-anchored ribosome-binding protein